MRCSSGRAADLSHKHNSCILHTPQLGKDAQPRSKTCSFFVTIWNHENVSSAFSGVREAQFCCVLCVDAQETPASWHLVSFPCEMGWLENLQRTCGLYRRRGLHSTGNDGAGGVADIIIIVRVIDITTPVLSIGVLQHPACSYQDVEWVGGSVEELSVFWPVISRFHLPSGFLFMSPWPPSERQPLFSAALWAAHV